MSQFRVGLSKSLQKPDGSPAYVDFDLAPFTGNARIDLVKLNNAGELRGSDVADLDALVLLGERFTRNSIDKGNRLALVARFGVGYDTVDVDACSENGIAVSITPDGVRRPVAVSVMAFLLALTGRMFEKDKLTREGPPGFARKSAFMGTGLVGRTFALIGVGNIGAETVRLAAPFGMKVVAHDPFANADAMRSLDVTLVELDELFRISDFISVHCPLSPTTRHLVNARRIALMKPTAFIINTARGPIIDQVALTAALKERRIAGAGLDVFDVEPVAADDPLLKLDNVILAPHALALTDQCFANIGASCAASTLAVMQGKVPNNLVDKGVRDNAAFCAKLETYARAFV